jgi:6,7-dimethyl-8-ribityllumazine synthase
MWTHAQPPAPDLQGTGLSIGIAVARYHWHITGAMLQLAQQKLIDLGVAPEDIHVSFTPGAYELASMAQAMLNSGHYHALICFGCVMKGETRHDVVVSDAAAQGIQMVALNTQMPIIFGVMCAENQQQAEARIGRGAECAEAAVEMALTVQALKGQKVSSEKEEERNPCLQGSLKK